MVCRRWKTFIRVNELHTFVCLLPFLFVSSLFSLLCHSFTRVRYVSFIRHTRKRLSTCDALSIWKPIMNKMDNAEYKYNQKGRLLQLRINSFFPLPANSFPLFILFICWNYFALTRPWFANVEAIAVICALCARLCMHSLHFMHLLNCQQCLCLQCIASSMCDCMHIGMLRHFKQPRLWNLGNERIKNDFFTMVK